MIPKRQSQLPITPPVLTPVFRYDAGSRATSPRVRLLGIGAAVVAIAAVFVPRLIG